LTIVQETPKINLFLSEPKFDSEEHQLWLVAGDVVSLYPNIDLNLLLQHFEEEFDEIRHLTSNFHIPLKNEKPTLVELFRTCLFDTVLQHPNTSLSKVRYALQTEGIPMGNNCAVEAATLYMHKLFGKLKSRKVIFRRFYIDDIFILLYGSERSVQKHLRKYNLVNPKISINWNVSKTSVDFLDLHISLNPAQTKMSTQTHQKELNKYLYLPPSSFHPRHTKLGFIKGELIRYARLSSEPTTFLQTSELFRTRLLARGYTHRELNRIFENFDYTEYHNKTATRPNSEPPIIFTIPYNPTTKNLNVTRIYKNLPLYKDLNPAYQNFLTAWSQPPSLGKILLRAALNPRTPPVTLEPPNTTSETHTTSDTTTTTTTTTHT
jgi:hypothetical protein